MSKKSRRRNRRLALLGALGAGLMLAGRGRNNAVSTPTTIMDNMPKGIDKKIVDVPVKTPTTIMDNMPKVGMKKGNILPKNELSKRITKKGEVYTIKDAKKGITKKIGNPDTAFVNKDYIYQDGMPYTKGRFGTFKAKQEMDRGMLPPQLRVPGKPNLTNVQGNTRRAIKNFFNLDGIRSEPSMSGLAENDAAAKKGGIIVKTEKGGKAVRIKKKKPIQLRGFGKARRG
tara:strand:- start:184 stop:870 length:687 start_codon:yes stop_codon:yes gene_type:complete